MGGVVPSLPERTLLPSWTSGVGGVAAWGVRKPWRKRACPAASRGFVGRRFRCRARRERGMFRQASSQAASCLQGRRAPSPIRGNAQSFSCPQAGDCPHAVKADRAFPVSWGERRAFGRAGSVPGGRFPSSGARWNGTTGRGKRMRFPSAGWPWGKSRVALDGIRIRAFRPQGRGSSHSHKLHHVPFRAFFVLRGEFLSPERTGPALPPEKSLFGLRRRSSQALAAREDGLSLKSPLDLAARKDRPFSQEPFGPAVREEVSRRAS